MKKVIAIMMVLAIVAGAVFAAAGDKQTHSLTVKTVVDEKLPAFQLRFTGKTITEETANQRTTYSLGNNATVSTNDDGTGTYAAETFVNKTTDYTDAADPLYVGFDLGIAGDHTATFKAYLVQNGEGYYAKTYKSFTLEFGGGRFTGLKVKGADITDVTKGDPKSIAVTEGSLASGGSISASGKVATIDFNGEACPDEAVAVATAVYTWAGITNLDMGAYTADITLLITNTN